MIYVAALMLGLIAGPAAADVPLFSTGSDFAASCMKVRPSRECVAYVRGVADALRLTDQLADRRLFCAPEDISGKQMTLAVTHFLRSHYDFRMLSPASIVWIGLSQEFPCPIG